MLSTFCKHNYEYKGSYTNNTYSKHDKCDDIRVLESMQTFELYKCTACGKEERRNVSKVYRREDGFR